MNSHGIGNNGPGKDTQRKNPSGRPGQVSILGRTSCKILSGTEKGHIPPGDEFKSIFSPELIPPVQERYRAVSRPVHLFNRNHMKG